MRIYRVWVLVGGTLLMVGAALPWIRFSIGGLARFSGYMTGLELEGGGLCPASPAAFTAAAGGILLLIALIDKGRPGQIYSEHAILDPCFAGSFSRSWPGNQLPSSGIHAGLPA